MQKHAQALQQRLVECEQETAAARQQLMTCWPSSGPPSPHTPAREACSGAFAASVARLRDCLDLHSLWEASPHGELSLATKVRTATGQAPHMQPLNFH